MKLNSVSKLISKLRWCRLLWYLGGCRMACGLILCGRLAMERLQMPALPHWPSADLPRGDHRAGREAQGQDRGCAGETVSVELASSF